MSSSSPTGTQFLQAAGCAEAASYANPAATKSRWSAPGDGATSEGEFWEIAQYRVPRTAAAAVLIEDNGYAISVPIECQTAGRQYLGAGVRISRALPRRKWTARISSRPTARCSDAVAHCREGTGPALVHAHVIRPYSHSLSDDERLYKTPPSGRPRPTRDPLS